MPTFARFGVSTPSRHPGNQDAYDPSAHRYRPGYVSPSGWVLNLLFLPSGLTVAASHKVLLPKEILSYQWTVDLIGGSFSTTVDRTRDDFLVNMELFVPTPGTYQITLTVNLADGSQETATRAYRLRDLLVVGIGDSFASGQGNPDAAAIPAPDQIVTCKATSIALTFDRVSGFLQELADELGSAGGSVLEYVPFAGKVLVAGIRGASDIKDFVTSQVDDIVDFGVDIGRTAAATFVEGVEEIAGLLGIGDGGEANETEPRPAAWQEPYAYRSYRSGQSLAARAIETETAFGATRVTFLAFGRTGSEIDSGLLGPRTSSRLLGDETVSLDGWVGDRGQIAEAKDTVRDRPVDAVLISIGVNDLGFSSLVTDSILTASGQKRRDRIKDAAHKLEDVYPGQLDALKVAIDRELKPRSAFITEYPIGIFKEIAVGAEPCGVLGSSVPSPGTFAGFDLGRPDATELGLLGARLNGKIRQKADEFGWIVVDGIEAGFDNHGYCARRSYFVSAEESCLNQGDFEGMLHPNADGHGVTRDCIAAALTKHLSAREEHWLEPVLHVMMV